MQGPTLRPRGGTSPCRSPSRPSPPPYRPGEGSARQGREAGIGQLGSRRWRLREIAPRSGRSSAPPRSARIWAPYARCDDEAVRQQEPAVLGATAANLCLLAAAVRAACVLAVPAIRRCSARPGLRVASAIGLTAWCSAALAALYGYRAREGNRLLRVAQHARPRRGRAHRHLSRIAKRAAAAVRSPRLRAWRCSAAISPRAARWLVARAQRHRVSPTSPTAGAASPRRSPSSAAVPPRSPLPGQMSWLALAGVVGTAFMAFALNREGLRRDRANADRYEEKAVALDQLSTRVRRGRGRHRRRAPRGADRVRRPGHGRAGDRAQAVARRHQAGRGRVGEPGRAAQGAARGTAQGRAGAGRAAAGARARAAAPARRGRTRSWCRG